MKFSSLFNPISDRHTSKLLHVQRAMKGFLLVYTEVVCFHFAVVVIEKEWVL